MATQFGGGKTLKERFLARVRGLDQLNPADRCYAVRGMVRESWRFGGAMECVWVAEGDAIERLIAEFADLTAGKIEAQYHLAVNSGNVRLCALILGERLTEWRRVTVTDDLSRALDLRVEWNDLIGQVRQQLGKLNTARGRAGSEPSEVLTIKPTIYGVGIGLKEVWRRLRRRVQKWRGKI
jgi:hypothetical protein